MSETPTDIGTPKPVATAVPEAAPAAPPPLSSALVPRATYRLQFHAGFRFDDATALVPYLHALGISHLYASPYLKARAGSTHGYDIVDHDALNPEIGDEAAYERLCAALAAHGMTQLLDVVPNHMGVLGSDNAWWADVLEHGEASRYAQTFDIDWTPSVVEMPGQVLLPVLGSPYGDALEAGELRLAYDAEAAALRLEYFEHSVPIDPRDYAVVLNAAPLPTVADVATVQQMRTLIEAFARLPKREDADASSRETRQRDQAIHKQTLAGFVADRPWVKDWLQSCADAFVGKPGDRRSFDALDALISRQAWRLAYWRVASDEVNYRRFFDVGTLAGLRMERADVFEATHRRILQWLAEGKLGGLRIDHPDGLAEPQRYFEQLQAAATAAIGAEPPRALYLLIEKILAEHEHWPDAWPVHGDTGYRYANLVNSVFVDGRGESAFDTLYADFIGRVPDYEAELIDAKRHIIASSLAADLYMLTEAIYRIAQRDRSTRDYTRNGLRAALSELAAGMPVYRTYIGENGVGDLDRQHLQWAAATARKRGALTEDATLGYIVDVMLDSGGIDAARLGFIRRFQQFTSPVMAKAMEDTAFYRYHRLLSLNDVGGDPQRFGIGVPAFHAANKARERYLPACMLASSTHDSKRSEDVRTRLDVLSEMPQAWFEALLRWRELRVRQVPTIEGEVAIDANDELLLFQTLVGMWPTTPLDQPQLAELRKRVQGAMQKSLREAKERSSWSRPDEAYEAAVTRCIDALLAQPEPNPFLTDLRGFVEQIASYGWANSLNLVALKLTSPGVPDIYQGCENWNFSLVDPDNRRPVDFALIQARQAELAAGWSDERGIRPELLAELRNTLHDGRLKQFVTWRLLQWRARHAQVFERGSYVPLEVVGPAAGHVIAFARVCGGRTAVTISSRLLYSLCAARGESPFAGARLAAWSDTAVLLPSGSAAGWRDVITGARFESHERDGAAVLMLADVMRDLPLAHVESVA